MSGQVWEQTPRQNVATFILLLQTQSSHRTSLQANTLPILSKSLQDWSFLQQTWVLWSSLFILKQGYSFQNQACRKDRLTGTSHGSVTVGTLSPGSSSCLIHVDLRIISSSSVCAQGLRILVFRVGLHGCETWKWILIWGSCWAPSVLGVKARAWDILQPCF